MAEKKITDREYLYLSAMLKARESRMLDRDKLERMLASGGFAEAAKLLQEDGWPDVSGENARGVNAALNARREEIFSELERVIPEKEVVEAFRLKYDYHNAKALIKSAAVGAECGHLLSGSGRVKKEALAEAFQTEDYRFLPPALGKAMQEARGVLARTENPQAADFLLDKAYFAELFALADKVQSPFLHRYAAVLADSANLRSIVRCTRMGKDPEFMRQVLIDGGNAPFDVAVRGTVTADELTELFSSSVFKEAAVLGAAAMEGGSMTEFERACDNAVNAFLGTARRSGFGSEVVVGYLAAEESNLTAVRMVLTGLLSGMDRERLKERLRDTYV